MSSNSYYMGFEVFNFFIAKMDNYFIMDTI